MSDSGPKTSEKIVSPYIPASLVRAATFRSIAGVPIIQGSSRDIASGALPEEAIAARLPKPRIDGSIVKSWLRRMFQGWLGGGLSSRDADANRCACRRHRERLVFQIDRAVPREKAGRG